MTERIIRLYIYHLYGEVKWNSGKAPLHTIYAGRFFNALVDCMFFKSLRADINAAKKNDPAARSKFEIWLTYSGVHALSWHRAAAFFYKIKLKLIARAISQTCRFFTGIEIHPAAKIAPGVFIDHGSGVVIGETAEVGEGTVLYQGCTLGGTGKETGKRHPTIGKNCVISAGAMVLGNITVGDYAKVGGGAVVLKDVPPHATVVGVPARIVRIGGSKDGVDLYQEKDDPYQLDIAYLLEKVDYLEGALKELAKETGKQIPEYSGKEKPREATENEENANNQEKAEV